MNIDTGELQRVEGDGEGVPNVMLEVLSDQLAELAGKRIEEGNTHVAVNEQSILGDHRRKRLLETMGLDTNGLDRLAALEKRVEELEDRESRKKWLGSNEEQDEIQKLMDGLVKNCNEGT